MADWVAECAKYSPVRSSPCLPVTWLDLTYTSPAQHSPAQTGPVRAVSGRDSTEGQNTGRLVVAGGGWWCSSHNISEARPSRRIKRDKTHLFVFLKFIWLIADDSLVRLLLCAGNYSGGERTLTTIGSQLEQSLHGVRILALSGGKWKGWGQGWWRTGPRCSWTKILGSFLEKEKWEIDIIIELFACNCLYSWSIVMQKQLSRAIKMLRVNCKVLACNIL